MPGRAVNRPQRSAPNRAAHITEAARGRPLSRLRTIAETAELLNVSPRTVRRLIDSGALPAHRFGRAVRIADEDIAVLLFTNRTA
jgi:excisionase family DNA binding protein